MFRGRERRFTSAHAVAVAALFFSLGGGAYAAVTSLPANSVGTKQLRDGSVTKAKLAPGVGKLTPKQILELKKIIKKYSHHPGPIGPPGPKGERGAQGEQGAPGPSDVYIGGAAFVRFEGSTKAIASTTVPSGQYLIQAKASIFGSAANEELHDVCWIASAAGGTEWDGTVLNLSAIATTVTSGVVSLAGADSFSGEQTVTLFCRALEGEAIADNARVWVTKVGSVHGLPVPRD